MTTKTFPTWKTLTLVVYPTVYDLARAVAASGSKIGTHAGQIMPKMSLTMEPVEYELVLASGRDLGITEGAKPTTIFAKASEHGLGKCPPELGPQLRRVYTDQPWAEALWIAMDPIAGADGLLYVFEVEHGLGGHWLDTREVGAAYLWGPDCVWVFTRRK